MIVEFQAELWRWPGDAAWHFVTLPVDVSDEIRDRTSHQRAGFGSVRVRATIGPSTWLTSVFPDKASGAYLLPVKAAVRHAGDLEVGDDTAVTIEVLADSADGTPTRPSSRAGQVSGGLG